MSKLHLSQTLPTLGSSARFRVLTIAGMFLMTIPALAANTTTTLTPSDTTITAGTKETLTAVVTSGSGAGKVNVSPGFVDFYDRTQSPATLLGTGTLNAAGSASINVVLGIGAHDIRASFESYGNLNASNSAITTVTVSTANGGSYVDTGVLTQTGANGLLYTATFYGQPAPKGTVSFTDNGSQFQSISNGTLTGLLTPSFDKSRTTTSTPTSNVSLNTVTGDFNNDGIPDLAISNTYEFTVSVLIGDGTGNFSQPHAPYATGLGPYGLVAGDFNADGYQDLAVTNAAEGSVSILLNEGGANAGTFAPQVSYPTATNTTVSPFPEPYAVVTADVNNDGVADLIVTNTGQSSVSVLLGNKTTGTHPVANGTFKAPVTTTNTGGTDSFGAVVADIDEDGNPDLVVLNSFQGTVDLLLGNGDGTFGVAKEVRAGNGNTGDTGLIPYSAVVGDFNDDGHLDVAVTNLGSDTVSILQNSIAFVGGHLVRTLTQVATPVVGINTTNGLTGPTSIALLPNYTGDGSQSLAVTNYVDNSISIVTPVTNSHSGAVTYSVKNYPGTAGSTTPYYTVTAADFNGDGAIDLAINNFGGNVIGIQLGTQTAAVVPSSHTITAGHTLAATYTRTSSDAYKQASSSLVAPSVVTASVVETTKTVKAKRRP